MLLCCLMRFTYKKIHNTEIENLKRNLYKGVMTFMINSLKKSFPFVINAVPETKIEGKWLSEHHCITSFNSVRFNVCAIISDNHSTNVLALKYLFSMYENEQKGENIINYLSNIANHIYLFFDSVHLLKNIRKDLFNSQISFSIF